MEFQASIHQELHTANGYLFDECEYDDDVFYCELRRQVLQLTAEDDDDQEDLYENKINPNSAPKQGLNIGPHKMNSQIGSYYSYWPGEMVENTSPPPPASISNLWRSGNGTGVFIPQITQSKRRNRPRGKRNERGRTYRPVEKM